MNLSACKKKILRKLVKNKLNDKQCKRCCNFIFHLLIKMDAGEFRYEYIFCLSERENSVAFRSTFTSIVCEIFYQIYSNDAILPC